MDTVSWLLVVGILVWGLIGAFVGLRTLSRQQNASEEEYRRLWLGQSRYQEVQEFIQQTQPLLDSDEVDPYVFARVLRHAVGMLQAMEQEITSATEDAANQPLANLQNLLTAYRELRAFCGTYLAVWEKQIVPRIEQESKTIETDAEDSENLDPEGIYNAATQEVRDTDAKVSSAKRRLAMS